MKKLTILFFCFMAVINVSYGEDKVAIGEANKKVKAIDDARDDLYQLEIKQHVEVSEGVPPSVVFFYKPEREELVLVEFSAGHEIFSVVYKYYFENKKIIKYSKEILNRPDNPPKRAIIYGSDGSVLWKNTINEPVISVKNILEIYSLNMRLIQDASKY
ncbi:MAG: hypothetical protein OEZ39_01555 [Gammaproteobacteria bacterium]|nr:hypothetical protein [Gammaproteobacteria bacterium]MDH5650539.1 hypothetical protein [Gammaproteobacteria bacterium]